MNKNVLFILAFLIITFSSLAQKKETYKDSQDGKTYKTLKIGNQEWMAENLTCKASSGT